MKPPLYVAATKQQQHEARLNPFAVELLAESFAQHRAAFGEESICVVGWGKDRQPVYIWLSSVPPEGVLLPETAQGGGDLTMAVRLPKQE
jgi:hypothetical protein